MTSPHFLHCSHPSLSCPHFFPEQQQEPPHWFEFSPLPPHSSCSEPFKQFRQYHCFAQNPPTAVHLMERKNPSRPLLKEPHDPARCTPTLPLTTLPTPIPLNVTHLGQNYFQLCCNSLTPISSWLAPSFHLILYFLNVTLSDRPPPYPFSFPFPAVHFLFLSTCCHMKYFCLSSDKNVE